MDFKEANKTYARASEKQYDEPVEVTEDELRRIVEQQPDQDGLDHAMIASKMGAAVVIGDTKYRVKKDE